MPHFALQATGTDTGAQEAGLAALESGEGDALQSEGPAGSNADQPAGRSERKGRVADR